MRAEKLEVEDTVLDGRTDGRTNGHEAPLFVCFKHFICPILAATSTHKFSLYLSRSTLLVMVDFPCKSPVKYLKNILLI